MKKWTIGKQIIASNAILITLLLIVSGITIASLRSLENFAYSRLRMDSIPGIAHMSDMAQLTSEVIRQGLF